MMAASAEQQRRYSRFVSWGKGDVNVALALEAWKQRDPEVIVQEAARQVERAILLDASSAKGSSAVRQQMFARAGEMFELAISVAPDDWRILHMCVENSGGQNESAALPRLRRGCS